MDADGVTAASEGVPGLFGAPWWDAAQAIGTLAAVLVAVGLALVEGVRARSATRERDQLLAERAQMDRVAAVSLVSAWVETDVEPSSDASRYVRKARLLVANESAEPVFNVHVVVGMGDPPVQIGPLAAPEPLPVLPARRQRSWDVSLGLLAHSGPTGPLATSSPVVRMHFTDARGTRWHRDFGGRLAEADTSGGVLFNDSREEGVKQLGDLTNPFNPMGVAHLFATALHVDGPLTVADIRPLLADYADGWDTFDEQALTELRAQVADYGLAAHVRYPAPQVAHVRLVHDGDARSHVGAVGFVEVRALPFTLTYTAEHGWSVFGMGALLPEWIKFPPGSVADDPRLSGES